VIQIRGCHIEDDNDDSHHTVNFEEEKNLEKLSKLKQNLFELFKKIIKGRNIIKNQ